MSKIIRLRAVGETPDPRGYDGGEGAIQLFGASFRLTPLVPFFCQSGETLGWEEMLERAGRHRADLGTPYATAFSRKYRNAAFGLDAGAFIVFPGAQRRDSNGKVVELCLFWNGEHWTTVWGLFELGYEQDIFFLAPESPPDVG